MVFFIKHLDHFTYKQKIIISLEIIGNTIQS